MLYKSIFFLSIISGISVIANETEEKCDSFFESSSEIQDFPDNTFLQGSQDAFNVKKYEETPMYTYGRFNNPYFPKKSENRYIDAKDCSIVLFYDLFENKEDEWQDIDSYGFIVNIAPVDLIEMIANKIYKISQDCSNEKISINEFIHSNKIYNAMLSDIEETYQSCFETDQKAKKPFLLEYKSFGHNSLLFISTLQNAILNKPASISIRYPNELYTNNEHINGYIRSFIGESELYSSKSHDKVSRKPSKIHPNSTYFFYSFCKYMQINVSIPNSRHISIKNLQKHKKKNKKIDLLKDISEKETFLKRKWEFEIEQPTDCGFLSFFNRIFR